MTKTFIFAIALATVSAGAAVTADAVQAQSGTIPESRARAIALARVANNQGVESSKLKTRSGILVYEFDIETPGPGHREIRVDAHTGAVVADQHEDDLIGGAADKAGRIASKAAKETAKTAKKVAHEADKEADKVFGKDEVAKMGMPVTEAQARRIALRTAGSGSVKDIDLERENGVFVWEVDVDTAGKGHQEVLIDAHSGAVIQQKHKD
jgi:uncharacterized membrane protein YkoI